MDDAYTALLCSCRGTRGFVTLEISSRKKKKKKSSIERIFASPKFWPVFRRPRCRVIKARSYVEGLRSSRRTERVEEKRGELGTKPTPLSFL